MRDEFVVDFKNALRQSSWLLIAGFFFALYIIHSTIVHAAGITWTTTTVASSLTASSTRILWDTYRTEFAIGLETAALSSVQFVTSTSGSAWSSAVTVGSVSNLSGITMFTTSSLANGAYYFVGAVTGGTSKVYQSSNQGASFSSYDYNGVNPGDYFANGQVQAAAGPVYYIAGRVDVGATPHVVFASTTASVNVFATSSIATLAANPTVDMAYGSGKIAVVYVVQSDTTLYMVTSSSAGPPWTSNNLASGAGMIINPSVKIDTTGKIWVTYIAANAFNCSSYCEVRLSRYESSSGWNTEAIDSVSSIDSNSKPQLAFVSGTTPVIAYYSGSTLKYAYRDSGNSGCSGTDAASYSCGTVVASSGVGPLSIATNHADKAVITYQAYPSTLKAAYADLTAASSSGSSSGFGLLAPIPVLSPFLSINSDNVATATTSVVLQLGATNASEMAVSLNPDFFGEVWRPLQSSLAYKLNSKPGVQRVYAKFDNVTGGISKVVYDDILYDPTGGSLATTAPVVSSPPPSFAPAPEPVITNPPGSSLPKPDEFSGPEILPFANEEQKQSSSVPSVSFRAPSCPQRPNAFALGGSIIQDAKSHQYFLLIANSKVVCPALSRAIAASWGVTGVAKKMSIAGYTISSLLPYRPGSIVQDSKSGARYIVNTKGQLHWFPTHTQQIKLGYGNSRILLDSRAVFEKLGFHVPLTRLDIHPDGTLFVIDAKKGEFAMLQNRILHPISRASLLKFKENPRRAVRFAHGETYPIGVRW